MKRIAIDFPMEDEDDYEPLDVICRVNSTYSVEESAKMLEEFISRLPRNTLDHFLEGEFFQEIYRDYSVHRI